MASVYAYGRMSTRTQEITLGAQEHACKSYFEVMKTMEPDIKWVGFYPDAAISGKIPFFQRPMGQELALKMKPNDKLIVSNLDRIFRGVIDCAHCLEAFNERQIALVILDLNVRTDTPLGKAFMTAMVVFKQLEREECSRRTSEALRHKVRQGKPVGGYAPLGWRKIGKGKNSEYEGDIMIQRLGAELLDWVDNRGNSISSFMRKMKRRDPKQKQMCYHHRKLRKLYVAAKCGFPKISEYHLPSRRELMKYVAEHDGRLPRLEAYAVPEGRLHTLPPIQD